MDTNLINGLKLFAWEWVNSSRSGFLTEEYVLPKFSLSKSTVLTVGSFSPCKKAFANIQPEEL